MTGKDTAALVRRLRDDARREEVAHKMLADAKTARQTDREDAWTDAGYDFVRAEQTSSWKAADLIEAQAAEIARFTRQQPTAALGLVAGLAWWLLSDRSNYQ